MKKLPLIALLWVLALSNIALAAVGHDVEDGAGGILIQGQTLTVADGQVFFLSKPETAATIPSLNYTLRAILNTSVSDFVKTLLLEALNPGSARTYYRTGSAESSVIIGKLIEQESKLTGTSIADTKIFAVTDVAHKNTVLLSSFYDLQKPSEQAKVLLRAAMLSKQAFRDMDATFQAQIEKTIFDVSEAFQNLLEHPQDPAASAAFYSQLSKVHPFDREIYDAL